MTSVISVCNLALSETGQRITVSSIYPPDGTAASLTLGLIYEPKTQALLRAANWDFARKQVVLTQLKAAVINGEVSADPPPQPFLYEYAWPPDCLKARFIMQIAPTQPAGTPLTTAPNMIIPGFVPSTRVPFVVSSDVDANGNAIKVILTNMPNAQLVYTADLSQFPDMWDDLFLTAETAMLAMYLTNALARDKDQFATQGQIVKGAVETARAANGNEALQTADLAVDWIRVRSVGGVGYSQMGYGTNGALAPEWDEISLPGGLRF